jgi:hypothetical protein
MTYWEKLDFDLHLDLKLILPVIAIVLSFAVLFWLNLEVANGL